MIWSVWSWTALTRSSLGPFFRFVLAIGPSSISASSAVTIIIVEVIGLLVGLSPHQPRFRRGTVLALVGFEPYSPPVVEPVGVVPDHPATRARSLDLDLGQREIDSFFRIMPGSDDPVLLTDLALVRSQ